MDNFIAGLPKAELHVHIEGTFEPELKFEIAKRNKISLPYTTIEECIADYTFTDLSSFLKIYYQGMDVLQNEQDFYDLTYAYLKKSHEESIVYTEIFFDPQAHTRRGLAFETVITGIHRAQEAAENNMGIKSQLIMCFLRDMSPQSALETLVNSLPFKEWIVGVGLDSDERDNPPLKFKDVFTRARQEGFKLTMHCDVDQQNSVTHHWQCLDDIGVDRIDHGINCLDDENLWKEIKQRNLALTVCPISNNYVTQSTKSEEIKIMLDRNICVTLNSDDPAYFQAYLNDNYIAVQKETRLTLDQISQLARNSFKGSWLPKEQKDHFIAMVNDYASNYALKEAV